VPDLPDQEKQLLTILQCVANAPWGWGRQTLIRILLGDTKARRGRRALHEKACDQAEFGVLDFRSKAAIGGMLDDLEQAGLLAARRLKHGGEVLDLTVQGRAALADASVPAVFVGPAQEESSGEFPRVSPDTAEAEPDVDEVLYATLRAWRLEHAREQGVPSFVIFHDSHLRAIATHRPTTPESLLKVKGVGQVKLEKYGASIIGLVQEHVGKKAD
jgi:superfamily II DNA helicase RecQ